MRTITLIIALLALAISALAGTVPTKIAFQGRLTDAGGAPLTGTYSITFKIFDAPLLGTMLWNETQSLVVTDGLFSANLGSHAPIDPSLLFNPNNPTEDGLRYLETQLAGQLMPMTPRSQLVCSPFALVAGAIASSGTILSERTLQLTDLDAGKNTNIGPGELTLESISSPDSMARWPMITSLSARMTRCSLSFADTTGETLAVLDGSLGQLTLGSRHQAGIKLFDQAGSPNLKLAEFLSESGSGPALRFFNQAGQVMGVEPSPFGGGGAFQLFHPQSLETAPLAIMSSDFDGDASGESALRLFNVPASPGPDPTVPQVLLKSSISGGELRLGKTTDPATTPYIKALSSGSQSRLDLYGVTLFPPFQTPIISLTTPSTGARVGIGTSTPEQALHVVGNICYTGTIGACSDARLKKDLTPLTNALDAVGRLSGVTYSWRFEDFPERQFSAERQVGVTAQEVQAVLPEAVISDSDGYLSVDYSRLTPLLIEAIKELKRQNEELIKRLERVEQQLKS